MAVSSVYTLKSLSEQVIRIFNESRPTVEEKLDRREVSKVLRTLAAEKIGLRWYKVRQTGEVKYLGGLFMATFKGVEVSEDVETGENYIDLQAMPEDLPDDTGLQGIRPETGKTDKDEWMIPIPPNADMIINQLPAGALQHRFGFRQMQFKVFFTEVRSRTLLDEKINTVEIRMITVGPEDVADDAPFPFPNDMIVQLLKEVLAIFGVEQQQVADLVNDNQ